MAGHYHGILAAAEALYAGDELPEGLAALREHAAAEERRRRQREAERRQRRAERGGEWYTGDGTS